MNSLYNSVADVIVARFGIDRALLRPDASFDDLGLDSLAQVELATALEKRLGVIFSDDEIIELSVVSEIVAKLEEKGCQV
jgi:acyl carrier protein